MSQNLSIEKIKIFENEFIQFMGIKDFPAYQLTTKEVSLAIADSRGFDSAASTFYNPKKQYSYITNKHQSNTVKIFGIPRVHSYT